MSYATQAALAIDPNFRAVVTMAMVTAARGIRSEALGTALKDPFVRRQAIALAILTTPNGMVDTAAWALASAPAITAASSDAVIQGAVNTLILNLTS
jgi:hypothetical protein